MPLLQQAALLLLAACSTISALPHQEPKRDISTNCTSVTQRVPWTSLTEDEKTAYIQADLCLINSPSKAGIPGAVTRWDDLYWPHITETVYVHNVGAFLPFHRYYMTVHETLVRNECGYTGRMPYWDELADIDNMAASEIFKPEYFGGNGVGNTTRCIQDGPFVNTTLAFGRSATTATGGHCIYRSFSQANFGYNAQKYLDSCMAIDDYTDAWICWSGFPHVGGHNGVGGLMADATYSPGDPLFYLHHSYLDKLWWEWQKADYPARLTDMGGPNIPLGLQRNNSMYPPASVTDYFGDGGGNVTTLNHNLWMTGVVGNLTIADVMNLNGPAICAEYLDA